MSKVAVIYWSGTGNTEAMAKAVLRGAQDAGASAQLFHVGDFNAASAASFDGAGSVQILSETTGTRDARPCRRWRCRGRW